MNPAFYLSVNLLLMPFVSWVFRTWRITLANSTGFSELAQEDSESYPRGRVVRVARGRWGMMCVRSARRCMRWSYILPHKTQPILEVGFVNLFLQMRKQVLHKEPQNKRYYHSICLSSSGSSDDTTWLLFAFCLFLVPSLLIMGPGLVVGSLLQTSELWPCQWKQLCLSHCPHWVALWMTWDNM